MNRLLLQVTYRCTSCCRHCMYCATNRDGALLTAGDVERIIAQARPSECVLFTGGEASLAPEVVLHGMRVAKAFGIDSWLASNGSWGKNPDFAVKFAHDMVASGLTRANISVDALHQEFVPFDSVLSALRALQDAGVRTIKVAVTFVDRQKGFPVDRRTEGLLSVLNRQSRLILDIRPRVSFMGRAISGLRTYAPRMTPDEALRDSGPEDIVTPSYYTVGAEGKVSICPGFAYPGDLHAMEFKDIICEENILGNELVAAFHVKGVRGLFDYAMMRGYSPLKYYCGGCHLCLHVRDFLRPDFPDIFTPAHAYGNEVR